MSEAKQEKNKKRYTEQTQEKNKKYTEKKLAVG